MYIVAKIHNGSLGRTFEVEDQDKGIDCIRDMAEEHLGRELTPEEIDELDNNFELVNDEDSDNQYTWAIGIVETL